MVDHIEQSAPRDLPEPPPSTSTKIPTNIEFLDRAMLGGQGPLSVNAILGPTGTGKTTLAAMVAAEGALLEAERAGNGGEGGRWVFISSDQRVAEIHLLVMSHAAMIRREVLERATNTNQLSTTTDLSECERKRIQELRRWGDPPPGEQERYFKVRRLLDQHLAIFSTLHDTAGGFDQAIDPIVRLVESVAQPGRPVRGVVIDYVGLVVDKYASDQKIPAIKHSRLISEFVMACRDRIVVRHQCPMWIVQQLAGAVGGRSFAAPLDHTDAAGCRNFGVGCDVCFVIGSHEPTSSVFQLRCTKAPDEPPTLDPCLLRIDRDFATVQETREHRHDIATRRVVAASTNIVDVDPDTLDALRERAAALRRRSR